MENGNLNRGCLELLRKMQHQYYRMTDEDREIIRGIYRAQRETEDEFKTYEIMVLLRSRIMYNLDAKEINLWDAVDKRNYQAIVDEKETYMTSMARTLRERNILKALGTAYILYEFYPHLNLHRLGFGFENFLI